jgi:CRISPR-associated protein Cmr5
MEKSNSQSKQSVIESGRAEYALSIIKKVLQDSDDEMKKNFKSYARKFPALVLANGLAAAIAFVVEKKDGSGQELKKQKPKQKQLAYTHLYNAISDWLKSKGYFKEPVKLEEYICSLDSDTYRVATNEVNSLFIWLRRFASGLIEGEA